MLKEYSALNVIFGKEIYPKIIANIKEEISIIVLIVISASIFAKNTFSLVTGLINNIFKVPV